MRAVLFCNELLGFGHLRISLALAGALTARDELSTSLVVTGFAPYGTARVPPRVDVLKLPCAPASADFGWEGSRFSSPAELSIPPDAVLELRAELSLAAVRSIDPDVVVVDYAPLGRRGDLRPALEWLRERGRSTVAFGVRDFEDPTEACEVWDREFVDAVCGLYDLALVYNDAQVDDARIQALRTGGLPINRTGLVAEVNGTARPNGLGAGYLLVTCGGGIDGFDLLDAVLGAIATTPPPVPTVLVAGPMMPAEQVAELQARAAQVGARLLREHDDMTQALAGACAVISMAGYASVAEVLGSGKPALLVPRISPHQEQLARALYWSSVGRVEVLRPDELEPERLGEAIAALLEREVVAGLPLDGAARAAEILC